MAHHNDLGKLGEDAAVRFLEGAGHVILERNFRCGRAEVDIISSFKNFTVFTEVKLRSSDDFGQPEEFVNSRKKSLIKKAADEYMHLHKLDTQIRFDIISIIMKSGSPVIFHIGDAYFSDEADSRYN